MIGSKKTLLLLHLLQPVWHAVIIGAIFFGVYKLRLITDLIPGLQLRIPPIDTMELMIFAIVAIICFVVIGLVLGVYRFDHSIESGRRSLLDQWFFWLVVMTFVAYFGHGFVFVSGISRFILVWTALLSGMCISLFDRGYGYLLRMAQHRHLQRILCVYRDESQLELLRSHVPSRYEVHGLPAQDRQDVDYTGFEEVVVMGDYPQQQLQEQFDRIRLAHHTLYHVSEGQFLDNIVYTPARVGSLNAYRYMPSRLDEWMRVIKKLFDLTVSSIALLLLSPLLILIGLLIMIDSRGPILYRQSRIGKNGCPFMINKFRTMYTHLSVGDGYGGDDAWKLKQELMDSDANVRKGELQKIHNDPRVTRMGRLLRKTSLDELPSLWNVLIGEMSLVGPRPHEAFEVERYKPRQRRLLSIKPGITGYAQIKGRDTLTFDEEANYDLYYMEHWTLWFDLYIMVMTVRVLLKGR